MFTRVNGLSMAPREISDGDFAQIQRWLYETAGISLGPAKKALVIGRLTKRLTALGCESFGDYLHVLATSTNGDERQTALDLLTTNETYFFREPKHFDFLVSEVMKSLAPGHTLRVWSAACSSGEEPYTLATVLAEHPHTGTWEVVASDISTRVLAQAKAGVYPMERVRDVPKDYLHKYFLRGTGPYANRVMVIKPLRQRVRFLQINLNAPFPNLGEFDVVFLRNVMIYFDTRTKTSLVNRIAALLKPGGYFFIGHSESLNGVSDKLRCVKPSIYMKPSR